MTYYFVCQVDLGILVFLLPFGQVQLELVSTQNQSLQRIQHQSIAECWIDFTGLQMTGESYKSKVWLGVIKFLDVYKISIFSPGHIDSSGISNPSFQVLSFLLSMLLTYSHFPVLDFASVKLFHLEIRIDWLLQQWSWLQLHPEWVFLLNDTLANEAPTWKAASRRRSKFEEKSTVFYLYLLIDCFVMLQLSFQISWWYLSDCLVGRWRCWWRWTCSR